MGYKIFLLDAIGAALSLVGLYLIYTFHEFFGFPMRTTKIFMCIATLCLTYSATIYLIKPIKWRFYLRIIASINLIYGMFTMFHVTLNLETLTVYGAFYFIAEVLVIILLSSYEILLSSRSKRY